MDDVGGGILVRYTLRQWESFLTDVHAQALSKEGQYFFSSQTRNGSYEWAFGFA